MGYDDTPCRVSADLRRYQRDQDRAELYDAAERESREWEAKEALGDPEKLKRVLNDSELAAPFAVMFGLLDDAVNGNATATAEILSTVHRIRQQAYRWLLDTE